MKTLGVIGGLGPMATVYFLELVTAMADVSCDQEHVPICMQSIPGTPDRTAYILDQTKPNPLPIIKDAGVKLKAQGAECIAIPCVTAHYFWEELREDIGLPILSLTKEIAVELKRQGVKCVGILATEGTVSSNVLQDVLAAYEIDAVVPSKEDQDVVMDVIYKQIKAGKPADVDAFCQVAEHLKDQGAEKMILGCTELSLMKRDDPERFKADYVDSLDVLAKASLIACGLSVKPEYL